MSSEPAPDESHHLHPLSIPYRLVQQGIGLVFFVVFVGGPMFGVLEGAVGVAVTAALGLGIAVAVVGYAIAYYRRYEYELTPETFDIGSGVFARREREIPLHRIQNVDISQNVVQRVLGIAEVRLETAGGSGAEAHLKFVGEERAEQLQREISRLRHSTGEQDGEQQSEVVFELSDRELGILAVVSVDLQLLSIVFVVASVFLPAAGSVLESEWLFGVERGLSAIVGPILTLVGIVLLGLVYGVVNAAVYYGFTLRRNADELRYERGLLQRYSGTIPLSKVQSLTVEENVLARALGYAALDIETAGQSGSAGGRGVSQSAIPIADRGRVLELVNTIESVGQLRFERPPKRARQRYAARYAGVVVLLTTVLYLAQAALAVSLLWWAPLVALLIVPVAAHVKWKHRGYHVGEDHIVTRNGFWVRQLKIVPYYRVQTVLSSETVFQRRRNLGSVVVDTAGVRSILGNDAKAVDVAADTAAGLRETIADSLYASLQRQRDDR